ncbi:PREDICTED: odorant receptor 67a-like [Trachymyrmex cornetzi]|uniref:odorant receptor 67a-like n=1 Tax=Trachymyrmex cornetzi TaxID=471704 RepID=UPI00084EDDE7|nr:PREDICTED: odorant receptor 67a-like [Trachymyrmex cornetzi]
MNFQNTNSLNVRLNLLSGNLLPMINRDSSFPFFWKMHSVFVWIIHFILIIAIISGCIYVPIEKALDGMLAIVIFTEILFAVLRIFIRKNLAYKLIQKLNEILHIADEVMNNVVIATFKPIKIPINFYLSSGLVSIIVWSCIHFVLIFEKNLFYYEDYRMPAAFSEQPFSFRIFLLGDLFILIVLVYMYIKKVSVEVYIMHLVLMVTAQYRYIAIKIAMVLQEKNEENKSRTEHSPEHYWKKEKQIKALCRHHNDVIYLTLLLKELLSLNFSLMYVMSVFRFCFIGILFTSITSTTFGEAISIVVYTSGATVQLYILCSCVQQLLDASTELTDKAFHENWYLLESSTKHIFILIIMANNLECRIATFKNFNFSLSSFMTILNQSYTIAILFLKMK